MRRALLLVLVLIGCAPDVQAETLRVGIDNISVSFDGISNAIQNDDTETALITLLQNQLLMMPNASALSLQAVPTRDSADKAARLADHRVEAIFVQDSDPLLPIDQVETQPLFSTQWRILTLQNRRSGPDSSQNDLNFKRLVVVNTSAVHALQQRYPHIVLTPSASLGDAITLLRAGAVDGVVCQQRAAEVLSENIFPGQFTVHEVDHLVTQARLRLHTDQAGQLAMLNQAIAQLPTVTIQAIISRNVSVNTLMNTVPQLVESHRNFDTAAVIVGIICLFLISFLISQILRRRQAEHRLRDTVKFWETLLQSLPTPVLVCNAAGNISHVNQALCQSLMVNPQQIIDHPVEHLNQRYFASPSLDTPGLVQALTSTAPQFFDGHFSRQGNSHSVVGWITPYSNTHMVPQGLVIGWYDISERIRLEEQLAQALSEATAFSHEKSEFLARMSHEIRSPMNVIMGVLEMENQRIDNPQSPLAVAYRASRGLLQIIGNILDLSKIEAGEMPLKPTPVSLYALLEKAAESYGILAERKGLRLDTNFESCYGNHYLLDEGKMVQILNNLLSNAVKYTEEGHIALSAQVTTLDQESDRLSIEVSDSGVGIAADQLSEIIQPYQQASTIAPDSTGLGLAICQQLVTLMGGQLNIRSRPHSGSTFSVTLQVKRIAADKVPQATPDAPGETGYRLWVIDDLPANLIVMKMQLSALGHEVTTFDNATQALTRLQENPPPQVDMILTDCQMPGMTGYAFATELRRLEGEAPRHQLIVGCTANAFSDEEAKCLHAGMDSHLTKPITQADLQHCLQQFLQNRRLDLSEVMALSAGQTAVIATLLGELQNSSAQDIALIEQAFADEDWAELKSRIHRLKGNFALTQFDAGQNICMVLERKLANGEEDIQRHLLRLQTTTRHFISLLFNFSSRQPLDIG